jgi:hypothetical protein
MLLQLTIDCFRLLRVANVYVIQREICVLDYLALLQNIEYMTWYLGNDTVRAIYLNLQTCKRTSCNKPAADL